MKQSERIRELEEKVKKLEEDIKWLMENRQYGVIQSIEPIMQSPYMWTDSHSTGFHIPPKDTVIIN